MMRPHVHGSHTLTAPRFCLHCGSPLAERLVDGELRMACPACPYVHFDNPVAVSGVIIRREHEVLLVRPRLRPEDEAIFAEHPDTRRYVLVSGYLEAFESAEQTAMREAKEETGLDIEIERLVGSYSCRPINKNMVFIVCLARMVGGALSVSEELADARWFPLDTLPDWPADWPVACAFADLLRDEQRSLPLPSWEGSPPGP
jgi:NADH pyrophosphatase NudC (nudix superfamily)